MHQQEFRVGPALVLFANQVFCWDTDVREEDLVQVMDPVDADDRTHFDAWRLHIDQEERDALLRLGFRIRPDKAEDPISPMGLGCPDFLSVDDIFVTVADGTRLEACEI